MCPYVHMSMSVSLSVSVSMDVDIWTYGHEYMDMNIWTFRHMFIRDIKCREEKQQLQFGEFCQYMFCLFIPFVVNTFCLFTRFVIICFVFLYVLSLYVLSKCFVFIRFVIIRFSLNPDYSSTGLDIKKRSVPAPPYPSPAGNTTYSKLQKQMYR